MVILWYLYSDSIAIYKHERALAVVGSVEHGECHIYIVRSLLYK